MDILLFVLVVLLATLTMAQYEELLGHKTELMELRLRLGRIETQMGIVTMTVEEVEAMMDRAAQDMVRGVDDRGWPL